MRIKLGEGLLPWMAAAALIGSGCAAESKNAADTSASSATLGSSGGQGATGLRSRNHDQDADTNESSDEAAGKGLRARHHDRDDDDAGVDEASREHHGPGHFGERHRPGCDKGHAEGGKPTGAGEHGPGRRPEGGAGGRGGPGPRFPRPADAGVP